MEIGSGEPIGAALVELKPSGRVVETGSEGRFRFRRVPAGTVTVRVTRLGYEPGDTTIVVTDDRTVVIRLDPRPIRLKPLTARARRRLAGAERARALFEREPRPGVVAMSRREIEAVPVLAAPDVLRSLQALPGVVQLNSLSAELHVRGGGPDQNLFLLDGARVFAPYHMFGIFGVFNTDAIGRVTFYRGALPVRYGGALSSVVDISQRSGISEPFAFDGGLSLLAVRGTARGTLPWAEGEWLLAGRRTHADLIARQLGSSFPYAFHDLQGRLALTPAPRHRVRASFFTSEDRFEMFLGNASERLESSWGNTVGSLRWRWNPEGDWTLAATAWGSMYDGRLTVGDRTAEGAAERLTTTSRVRAGGLRIEAMRRGEETGLRIGLDLRGGEVALLGSEAPGSYLVGGTRGTYFLPAAYIELEHWLGPVRLAPGLRVGYETTGGRLLVAPRLAARYYFSEDWTLTVGAGRTHQILSTLRDDRYPLPGAPLWFLRPEAAGVSTTDAVSVELTGWIGRGWEVTAAAYAKRLRNVPHWRPVGRRTLDAGLSYDAGNAVGFELMVRKHAGRVSGWFGYGFGRVRLSESGFGKIEEYYAPWDRRHSVDAALFIRIWEDLSLSARATYATGRPFWPVAGYVYVPEFQPLAEDRYTEFLERAPFWAHEQMRYPAFFRLDLGVRYAFHLWGAKVEPYAGVLNITGRRNVLYYDISSTGILAEGDSKAVLVPVDAPFPFTVTPSLGIDVHF